jgi:hypothetical protein
MASASHAARRQFSRTVVATGSVFAWQEAVIA